MKLHFTSGYHPEGDGQTEWTNQTLEQYLWIFCNYQQDNWYTLLPLAEFAYNNTPSATTGISPFFTNKGYHPNLTVHPEQDLASSRARDLVVNLDELQQELKSAISEAQLQYQGPANAKKSPALNFTIGEQAFVKAKFFRTTQPSHKLSDKFLGPFEILAKPEPIPLPSDFLTLSEVSTPFSMSPCLSLLFQMKFRTEFNLCLHWLILKVS